MSGISYGSSYNDPQYWRPDWTWHPQPWQNPFQQPQPPVRRRRIIIIEEWEEPRVITTTTTAHFCPLMDPANAGKAMLYYCPVCNGTTC